MREDVFNMIGEQVRSKLEEGQHRFIEIKPIEMIALDHAVTSLDVPGAEDEVEALGEACSKSDIAEAYNLITTINQKLYNYVVACPGYSHKIDTFLVYKTVIGCSHCFLDNKCDRLSKVQQERATLTYILRFLNQRM